MSFCSIQEGFSLFGLSTGSEEEEADTRTTVTLPLKWILGILVLSFGFWFLNNKFMWTLR